MIIDKEKKQDINYIDEDTSPKKKFKTPEGLSLSYDEIPL